MKKKGSISILLKGLGVCVLFIFKKASTGIYKGFVRASQGLMDSCLFGFMKGFDESFVVVTLYNGFIRGL